MFEQKNEIIKVVSESPDENRTYYEQKIWGGRYQFFYQLDLKNLRQSNPNPRQVSAISSKVSSQEKRIDDTRAILNDDDRYDQQRNFGAGQRLNIIAQQQYSPLKFTFDSQQHQNYNQTGDQQYSTIKEDSDFKTNTYTHSDLVRASYKASELLPSHKISEITVRDSDRQLPRFQTEEKVKYSYNYENAQAKDQYSMDLGQNSNRVFEQRKSYDIVKLNDQYNQSDEFRQIKTKNEEYLRIIQQYDIDKCRIADLEKELQLWKNKYYKLEFQEREISDQLTTRQSDAGRLTDLESQISYWKERFQNSEKKTFELQQSFELRQKNIVDISQFDDLKQEIQMLKEEKRKADKEFILIQKQLSVKEKREIEYQDIIKVQTRQIESYRKNDELASKTQAYEVTINSLQTKLKFQQQELSLQYKREQEQNISRIQQLETQYNEMESDYKILQQRERTYRSQLSDYQSQFERIKVQLQEKENESSRQFKEMEKWKESHTLIQNQQKDSYIWTSQIESLTVEMNKWKSEYMKLEQESRIQIGRLKEECSSGELMKQKQLKIEIERWKSQFLQERESQEQGQISVVQQQLIQCRREYTILERRERELGEQYQMQIMKFEELDKQMTKLRKEYTLIKSKESELTENQSQFMYMKNLAMEEQKRIFDLEKILTNLREDYLTIERKNAEYQDIIRRQTNKFEEFSTQYNEIDNQYQVLLRKEQDAQQTILRMKSSIEELTVFKINSQNEKNSLYELQQEVEHLRYDLRQSEQKEKETRVEFNLKMKEISELKLTYQSVLSENQRLSESLQIQINKVQYDSSESIKYEFQKYKTYASQEIENLKRQLLDCERSKNQDIENVRKSFFEKEKSYEMEIQNTKRQLMEKEKYFSIQIEQVSRKLEEREIQLQKCDSQSKKELEILTSQYQINLNNEIQLVNQTNQQTIFQLKERLKKFENENQSLYQQIDIVKQESESWQQKYLVLEENQQNEISIIHHDRDNVFQELGMINETLKIKQQEAEEWKNKYFELQRRSEESIQIAIQRVQTQQGSLQKELEMWKERYQQLEQHRNQIMKEYDNINVLLAETTSELDTLKNISLRSKNELSNREMLTVENRDLKINIQKLEAERKELTRQLQLCESEMKSYYQKEQDYAIIIQQKQDSNENHSHQKLLLIQQQFEESKSFLESELRLKISQLNEQDKTLNMLMVKIEERDQVIRQQSSINWQREIAEWKEQYLKLKLSHEQQLEERNILLSQIDKLKGEMRSYSEKKAPPEQIVIVKQIERQLQQQYFQSTERLTEQQNIVRRLEIELERQILMYSELESKHGKLIQRVTDLESEINMLRCECEKSRSVRRDARQYASQERQSIISQKQSIGAVQLNNQLKQMASSGIKESQFKYPPPMVSKLAGQKYGSDQKNEIIRYRVISESGGENEQEIIELIKKFHQSDQNAKIYIEKK